MSTLTARPFFLSDRIFHQKLQYIVSQQHRLRNEDTCQIPQPSFLPIEEGMRSSAFRIGGGIVKLRRV